MARAKIFRHGRSQAVRLPRDCRFPEDQREVEVRREGDKIVLEPVTTEQLEEWSPEFLAALGGWDEEIERPPQRLITELKDPFA